MAQTRANVGNLELGIKSLSQELVQARRDRDQTASAIDKLKNGLDKFMCHVAGRLDDEEQGPDECEAVDQSETM